MYDLDAVKISDLEQMLTGAMSLHCWFTGAVLLFLSNYLELPGSLYISCFQLLFLNVLHYIKD